MPITPGFTTAQNVFIPTRTIATVLFPKIQTPLMRELLKTEKIAQDVEKTLGQGQTVNIMIKPFLGGQTLNTRSANFTGNTINYGNETVTLSSVVGEAITLTPNEAHSILAMDAGNGKQLDIQTELFDILSTAFFFKLETETVERLRTNALFPTVGTYGTALTYADLKNVRRRFNKLDYPTKSWINVICSDAGFAAITNISEISNAMSLRQGNATTDFLEMTGDLNMRFFLSNRYTNPTATPQPMFTAFGEQTVVPVTRPNTYQDPATQQLVTVDNINMLLNYNVSPLNGSKTKTLELSALFGFAIIAPNKTFKTSGDVYFGYHVTGGAVTA